MPLTRRLADFAATLRFEDLSPTLQALARAQLLGWLGSLAAGWQSHELDAVLPVARQIGGPGRVPMWPDATSEAGAWGTAYAWAAASCAHDYDDYLFLAHTSHSACGVAMALGHVADAPLGEALAAMVAANEAMGRLGAACLLGPQNGQLWTHVHLAGAVLAGGRVQSLSPERIERALGAAYFQPPMALWPGFGCSAKVLSAATPTLQGLLALAHSADGLAGSPEALEGPACFLDRFSFLPLAPLFEDLGDRFVTRSLSIKSVPGCAYVSAPIEAALACARQFAQRTGRALHPADIRSVTVLAGPMTVGMERLLGHHAEASPLSPVAVNFSVPASVAWALVQGELDVTDLQPANLAAIEPLYRRVAASTQLRSDGRLGRQLVADVGRATGLLGQLAEQGLANALRAAVQAVRATPLRAARAGAPRLDLLGVAGALLGGRHRDEAASRSSDDPDTDFRFPFGAEVRVELNAGPSLAHRVDVPAGAAGHPAADIRAVARAKLLREAARYDPGEALAEWADELLSGALDDSPVHVISSRCAEALSRPPRRPPAS